MSSGLYKGIFPGTRIARNAASEIVTTRGGHRFGTSLDGSLTGRGGDIIIIDDPLKLSDAESDSKREHVNDTYKNTIQSRLDDNENGAIVIVMQRLHMDDLCGFRFEAFRWLDRLAVAFDCRARTSKSRSGRACITASRR